MISPDYSKDALLLDEEIYDFDTKDVNETGINSSRMRLPTRYDISKYYKRNKHNPERGQWKKKDPDSLIDFSQDFDWQITYSFPNTLRDPMFSGKRYGGSTVTFRRLYLILCEHFNGGEFFIDTYFNEVYPASYVKNVVDKSLDKIKSDLLDYASSEFEGTKITKSGKFDKRYKVNRGAKARLKRYESFAKEWEDYEGEKLADLIKEDIIASLESGVIPLNFRDEANTKRARKYADIPETPTLYATTQLINSLQLFVTIRGNKKWKTKQGIMV